MKNVKLREDAFSDELLLDIDFSEFDKVIGFQASKQSDEDEQKIDDTDAGVVVDFDDIDEDPMYDDIEELKLEQTQEEEMPVDTPIPEGSEEKPQVKEEDEQETKEDDEDAQEKIIEESSSDTDNIDEKCNNKKYKSLAEVYEIRKNFKTNKLVESILCDSVVDCVYDALISTLSAHGITKANAVVILGLMLDRMLKADDSEVVKPDFLKEVLGDLIDGDSDITDIVHDAIQNALTAEPPVKQICVDPELVKIQANGQDDVIEVENEEEE